MYRNPSSSLLDSYTLSIRLAVNLYPVLASYQFSIEIKIPMNGKSILPVGGNMFTNTNKAFPGAKCSLLLKMWMNCPMDVARESLVYRLRGRFHIMVTIVPQKSSVYISQYKPHIPEMTVREIIDFSAQYQGVGSRADIMMKVSRREKTAGIVPYPYVDAYMKAIAAEGHK